jgi:ElaB/YqjD/DUF883 family membrane-anchored ribosome-binding protein
MAIRSATKSVSDEVTTIEELMGDLEKRLKRLSEQARGKTYGESEKVSDLVSEVLDRLRSKMRETTTGLTQTIAEEATKVSSDAIKKLSDEAEHRPLLMLSVAAGIGFLVGLASRR